MFGHGPMPLCMHSKELGNIGMGKFNYAMIDMWFLYSNYIGFLNFFLLSILLGNFKTFCKIGTC